MMASAVVAAIAACNYEPEVETVAGPLSSGTLPPVSGPTTVDTPVGLALDIEDGVAVPFKVRKNQRFYLNQIDLRAAAEHRLVGEGPANNHLMPRYVGVVGKDALHRRDHSVEGVDVLNGRPYGGQNIIERTAPSLSRLFFFALNQRYRS